MKYKSHFTIYDVDTGFAFAWFLMENDALEFLEDVRSTDPEVNFEMREETRVISAPSPVGG